MNGVALVLEVRTYVTSQVPLPTVVKNYLGFVRQLSDGLSADA